MEEEYFPATELVIREMNSLRGRLCTTIESIGLPIKQERAIITLVKNWSYQSQAVIAEALNHVDNKEVSFRYSDKLDSHK